MWEKIKNFAQGNFEFELPFLCLSENEIVITVEAGKRVFDSFINV